MLRRRSRPLIAVTQHASLPRSHSAVFTRTIFLDEAGRRLVLRPESLARPRGRRRRRVVFVVEPALRPVNYGPAFVLTQPEFVQMSACVGLVEKDEGCALDTPLALDSRVATDGRDLKHLPLAH